MELASIEMWRQRNAKRRCEAACETPQHAGEKPVSVTCAETLRANCTCGLSSICTYP